MIRPVAKLLTLSVIHHQEDVDHSTGHDGDDRLTRTADDRPDDAEKDEQSVNSRAIAKLKSRNVRRTWDLLRPLIALLANI